MEVAIINAVFTKIPYNVLLLSTNASVPGNDANSHATIRKQEE